ncbi:hypothetical protein [Ralstonia wenshanensis]|nr:hypothetical protein [Ralstonia wenshanensis]MDY7509681.1 hypothetical protein [Ralstonia wenshanensis]
MSTSIEHKRVSMIQRTMAYLDTAPPQAVAHMAHLVSRASQELSKQ